jgi:hypothetical protein
MTRGVNLGLESLSKQIALTLEVERLAECAKSEADELNQNPL